MNETMHDVKKWLDIALKAVNLSPTIKVDENHVMDSQYPELLGSIEVDAFTIAPTRIEDGTLETRHPVDLWNLTVAVPIRETRDTPPDVDVVDLGNYGTAESVVRTVVKRMILDHLDHALRCAAEAEEDTARRKEAEEVF